MDPHAYVVAGPNGAGETTFAREYLPECAHCREFLNADLMAAGLSPFDPGSAAIAAGRLLLARLRLEPPAVARHRNGETEVLARDAYERILSDSQGHDP